jgi:hypothetical protein
LFGGGAEEREQGLLDRMRSKLDARDDVLSIGGRLFVQGLVTSFVDQPIEEVGFSTPSFLDIYGDARPSDRLRVYALGRIQSDFASRSTDPDLSGGNLFSFGISDTTAVLDQLWLKFDVARRVFVTVGQQRLRWGSGRFFNPTDFVNRQRINPVALLDQRLGIGLLKLHVPLEDQGINLYAILDFEEANQLDRLGGAARAEIARGQFEVAASVAYQAEQGLRAGIDLSAGVWELDVRSELALSYDDPTPFFEGDFSTQPLVFPEAVDRSDQVLVQAMVGAEAAFKTDDRGGLFIVGAEYFFNQGGYSDKDLYPFLILGPALGPALAGAAAVAEQVGAGGVIPAPPETLPDGFSQFTVSRHYVGAYATWVAPGALDDTTLALAVLADVGTQSSGTGTFTWGQGLLTFLSLQTFVNVGFGGRGAFKPLLADDRFQLVDPDGLGPVPDLISLLQPQFSLLFAEVPGLEPLVTAGLALSLSF